MAEQQKNGMWVWEENNPYEEQPKGFASRCQVIYLTFVENKTIDEILKVCRYVRSTIRTYIKKYENMLDEAKKFFKKTWVVIQENILHKKDFRSRKPHAQDYCAYIIECFKGNNFKFLKVGKASDFEGRMREHLRCKLYDIDGIRVNHVFNYYTEEQALAQEKNLRSFYQNTKGFTLTRNDRFYDGFFAFTDLQLLTS